MSSGWSRRRPLQAPSHVPRATLARAFCPQRAQSPLAPLPRSLKCIGSLVSRQLAQAHQSDLIHRLDLGFGRAVLVLIHEVRERGVPAARLDDRSSVELRSYRYGRLGWLIDFTCQSGRWGHGRGSWPGPTITPHIGTVPFFCAIRRPLLRALAPVAWQRCQRQLEIGRQRVAGQQVFGLRICLECCRRG
jgi:hypothetical protein